jgi:hypothetical protein
MALGSERFLPVFWRGAIAKRRLPDAEPRNDVVNEAALESPDSIMVNEKQQRIAIGGTAPHTIHRKSCSLARCSAKCSFDIYRLSEECCFC